MCLEPSRFKCGTASGRAHLHGPSPSGVCYVAKPFHRLGWVCEEKVDGGAEWR